jgi:hypothetical protein
MRFYRDKMGIREREIDMLKNNMQNFVLMILKNLI